MSWNVSSVIRKIGVRHMTIFRPASVKFGSKYENIIRGGRDQFQLLPAALEGVNQIGVIGWSKQGPAQAQNLRDSLSGSSINIKVGLRNGSRSMQSVREAGFVEENNTLGDMWDVIRESDMVLLLISDAAQVQLHKEIFAAMKPGATLGFSHGFLLGFMDSIGEEFPRHIDVGLVAPKGSGPSVRRLYLQGEKVNGAGINSSYAVHQDVTGLAEDRILAWAVGIGSPYIFSTTLRNEYRSDIFGERGILLGAIHGLCEFQYRRLVSSGIDPKEAYLRSVSTITGPVTKTISHQGILKVYEEFSNEDREVFAVAYSAAYHPMKDILLEIYDEVSSGREILSVCDHVDRLARYPMATIDRTAMWKVGEEVRPVQDQSPADPETAGMYIAGIIAQCDILMERGHSPSEVANESIIEAVDSLNPFMHHRGVAYMVDNCSITARIGSRKWAPRFDYNLQQVTQTALDQGLSKDPELMKAFISHPIHDILATCNEYRPSVDISFV